MVTVRGKGPPRIDWIALLVGIPIALAILLFLLKGVQETWLRVLIAGATAFAVCNLVQAVKNPLLARFRKKGDGAERGTVTQADGKQADQAFKERKP